VDYWMENGSHIIEMNLKGELDGLILVNCN